MLTWLSLNLVAALNCSTAIWSRYPTRARGLSVLAFLATAPLTWGILQANAGWAVTAAPRLPALPSQVEMWGYKIPVPEEAGHVWAYLQWSFTAVLPELPAEAQILGVKLEQDVAIYVMLDVDGEPRLFKLPWSNEAGSKLQRLMEANASEGGTLTAKRGQPGEDYPIEFHGEPQPPTPDKQPEAAAPTYERQG
jgi:hypothetical protein